MKQTLRRCAHPISLISKFFILGLLTLAVACGQQQIVEQIAQFEKSANAGFAAIAGFYSGLNAQELDLYFELLSLDPSLEVGDQTKFTFTGGDKSKDYFVASPLGKPIFPERAIQIRIRVLRELTEYTKNLALLAGSEAPADFQSRVSTLKDRLLSLKDALAILDKDKSKSEPAAMKYLDPISTIIGIVGKWYLNERRWSEIRGFIEEAEKPINEILDNVAEDLDDYVSPLLETGAEDRFTTAVVYYNLKRKTLNDQQRTEILKKIRSYKEAWDEASSHKPSAIPLQMKKAHVALVQVAKSNRHPQDLARLQAELSLFKDDVEQICQAVVKIIGKED